MRRAAAGAVLAACVLGVAVPMGSAQDGAIGGLRFGGGVPLQFVDGRVNATGQSMGMSVSRDGSRATIWVEGSMNCPRAFFTAEARAVSPVADSGAFVATGTSAFSNDPSGRARWAYRISGRVTRSGATGTLRMTGSRAGRGCAVRGNGRFTLRPTVEHTEGGTSIAARRLYGTVSRRVDGRYVAPIKLAASADGRRIAGAEWVAATRCRPRGRFDVVNLTPSTPIRVNGAFARNERYVVRFADGAVRYRVAFAGRVTRQGLAGRLRVRTSATGKRGGKVVERCDSGLLSWSATP